jgi:excisionase family DNA binding protein
MAGEYMSVGEAAGYLEVSKPKMIRLISEHGLKTFQDLRDKRKTLLRTADVERLRRPIPRG